MKWLTIVMIGLLSGFASGLFGVGGGLIFVPLMVLLLNFNIHMAIGTSLVAIIPTALVGAWRHFASNQIDFRSAFILAVFAMIGAWVGAGLSLRLDVVILRKIFAVFLLVAAFQLLIKQ